MVLVKHDTPLSLSLSHTHRVLTACTHQVAALASLEVATVVAGASHSFAITTDGALFSWGAGQCGRLGHGDEESQKAPLRVAGLQAHARTHTRAEHTHAHTRTHARTRARTHTRTRT